MTNIYTYQGDVIINNDTNELTTGIAKVVKINFLKSGIAGGYKDENNENYNIYISTEKMLENMVNCWDGIAIINTHQGNEPISYLTKAYVEEIKGEKWVCGEFTITDLKIINLLQNGYSVSCAYAPNVLTVSNNTHNGIVCKYDLESIKPIHIAIVSDPRYEEANAVIVNSKSITKNISKQFNFNNMSSFKSMIGLGKKPVKNMSEAEVSPEKKEDVVSNFKAFYKKNEIKEDPATPVSTEEATNEDSTKEGLEVIPMDDLMSKSITTAEGEVIPVAEILEFLTEYEQEEAAKAMEGVENESNISPEQAETVLLTRDGKEYYNLHNVMQKYLECKNMQKNQDESKEEAKEDEEDEKDIKKETMSNSKPIQKIFTLSKTIAKAETTGSFQNSLMNAKLGDNVVEKKSIHFSSQETKNILFPKKK